LISDVVPGMAGVGGVYLNDLCALYPADRLACCVIGASDEDPWPGTLARAVHTAVPRPPEHGFLRLGRHVHRRTRAPFERYVAARTRRDLVPRIVRFGREARIDAICVPLASPTSIRVARATADALGVPLQTLVWDPPRYYLGEYWKLRGAALDDLVRAFGAAVRRATRCGVMSDAMGDAYRRAYGTSCVIMQHGLARRWWRSPATEPARDRLTIAYAGSLYARDEWNTLLEALRRRNWRLGGRDVTIRFLGSRLEVDVAAPARIEFLGWRNRADTLALLSEADVCYLPYWFAAEYAEVVRQAFPTKLPTYLAAGRPVLFHAPPGSSPARFFDRYPAGALCASRDPDRVADVLESLVADPAAYRQAGVAGHAALEECFDLEIFRRRFAELLDVDVTCLNAVSSVP
jgi:glycosyltransferase involved in cell wall biosynthesis